VNMWWCDVVRVVLSAQGVVADITTARILMMHQDISTQHGTSNSTHVAQRTYSWTSVSISEVV